MHARADNARQPAIPHLNHWLWGVSLVVLPTASDLQHRSFLICVRLWSSSRHPHKQHASLHDQVLREPHRLVRLRLRQHVPKDDDVLHQAPPVHLCRASDRSAPSLC